MQSIFLYIGAFALSMMCGFMFIPKIIKFCLDNKLYDVPNGRKIHKNPIPRLGGLSFVPGMLLASVVVLFIMNSSYQSGLNVSLWSLYFCISLFIIYITGIVDDLTGLNATMKFMAEIVATAIMPLSGLYINNLYGLFGLYELPFVAGAPLTVLVMVFTCNAINLIDGIDGLSASLTMIALTGFFIGMHIENLFFYCLMIVALMGVLVPYLYHNIFGNVEKNQKIFMGDSGSLSLGFILGFLAIKFCMDTPRLPYDPSRIVWSWTLFAVPCFDVVRVFFHRILHHRSPFQPDKNHIHHKLMACGMSQHQALLSILGLQLLLIGVNAILVGNLSLTLILIIDISIYAIANAVMNIVISRRAAAINNISPTA